MSGSGGTGFFASLLSAVSPRDGGKSSMTSPCRNTDRTAAVIGNSSGLARRGSKRSASCDDDMSSSDSDDKPLVRASPFKASTVQSSPAMLKASIASPAISRANEVQSSPGMCPPSPVNPLSQAPSPAVTSRAAESPPHKRAATSSSTVVPQPEESNAESISVPAQVAECKARIAELQKKKELLLSQEDYMGAHHLKLQIQEQEQLLTTLRRQLDSMPTPARRASISAAKVSVNSGRAGKSPHSLGRAGRSTASALPHANAWTRPYPLAASLGRMGMAGATVMTPSSLQLSTSQDVSERDHAEDAKDDTQRGVTRNIGAVGQEGSIESDAAEESSHSEADEELPESEGSEAGGQWRTASTSGLVELPREQDARSSDQPFVLPRETFSALYPYQRAGVAWMARLWQSKQGGILADEMGLGKTVQVCALLNGARKAGASHAMMLLPVTLLDQWAKEARKWCPGWPVYLYHGPPNERARALRGIMRPNGGMLLTSYQTLCHCDALFSVTIADMASPRRYKKRDRNGQKRRRMNEHDDEGEEFEDSAEEEPCEPEIPGGGLSELGTIKPWDVIVCDEAHRLKNMSTLVGKTMRQLKSNCRILLTGTPVQNALQDLWSLMDFAQPGLLGNHATFVKEFSNPIGQGSVRGASPFQVELKRHLAEQLRLVITPHLLRRTKMHAGLMADEEGPEGVNVENDDSILEDEEGGDDAKMKKLPPKRETIVWLAPSTEQIDAYKQILERSDVIREACTKGKLGIEVFRAIGLLKKLCNHPVLLQKFKTPADWAKFLADVKAHAETATNTEATNTEAISKVDSRSTLDTPCVDEGTADVDADMESAERQAEERTTTQFDEDFEIGQAAVDEMEEDNAVPDPCIEETLSALPSGEDEVLSQSSKLRCLESLLPALSKRGHRTLVFSQSVKFLDLVQISCLKPHGLRCLRIDGQTQASARAEKVNKFNQQKDRFQCMLLTTNVGGVGLNLVTADRVVVVDPAWNPAVDAQAVDRAFRIGQTREVRVYRLIMSGLIEDKMFRLQVFKMGLSKTALETDQKHNYFSQKDIKTLFEWTDPAEGATRKVLLEKHGASSDDGVQQAAADDGSEEAGWFTAGPAVGLSDFSVLYGGLAEAEDEEEQNDECTAQVLEARQKLGAADEKLQRMVDGRKAAEENSAKQIKDLKQVNDEIEGKREVKMKLEEELKDCRTEVAKAKRVESVAQARTQKALKDYNRAESAQVAAVEAGIEAQAIAATAVKSAVEVASLLQASEDTFFKAEAEAQAQLELVDDRGSPVKEGVVECAGVDKVKKLRKAFEKLHGTIETMSARQTELDAVDEDLSKADAALAEAERTFKRYGDVEKQDVQGAVARKTAELNAKRYRSDRQKAEATQTKAQQKVTNAREAMADAVTACLEAGTQFAEALQKNSKLSVKVDQVKVVQTTVKAAFRQMSSAYTSLRKVREASVKAVAARRKAVQKAAAASASQAEAERWLDDAEVERVKAESEETLLREDLAAKEGELARAEASRINVEAEEFDLKKRRDALKQAAPLAKDAIKAARAAEKEAMLERSSLHSACSKVEKARQDMEEAKNSAMANLKAEEYDKNQVGKAYEKLNG